MIVGRHQHDLGVLQLAYAFQQANEAWKVRSVIVAYSMAVDDGLPATGNEP